MKVQITLTDKTLDFFKGFSIDELEEIIPDVLEKSLLNMVRPIIVNNDVSSEFIDTLKNLMANQSVGVHYSTPIKQDNDFNTFNSSVSSKDKTSNITKINYDDSDDDVSDYLDSFLK